MSHPFRPDYEYFLDRDDEVLSPLYQSLGRAVARWAYLEQRIAHWFQIISFMPPRMANDIFFSASSFNGRVELLRAALNATQNPQEDKLFTDAVVRKVVAYANFRNTIVHGYAQRILVGPGPREEPRILQPYGELNTERIAKGVTIDHLDTAATNFASIAHIIWFAQQEYVLRPSPPDPPILLSELRSQVELLPNQPWAKEPSQKQLERLKQRAADLLRSQQKKNSGKAP